MQREYFSVILCIIMMNLVKYIAFCGAASRRGAETLVRNGRVFVNQCQKTDPAYRVMDSDIVTLDGKILQPQEKRNYVLLNKPRGYVCSSADKHADLLAVDLIDIPGARLFSAGRLDKESQGAIIFSDDGDFVNILTHPRYEVLKTYHVETAVPLDDNALQRIRKGILDHGEMLHVISVERIGDKKYEFILNEGKKREIRRLTAACGAETVTLCRVAIGEVKLGDLPEGKYRVLAENEINSLIKNKK